MNEKQGKFLHEGYWEESLELNGRETYTTAGIGVGIK